MHCTRQSNSLSQYSDHNKTQERKSYNPTSKGYPFPHRHRRILPQPQPNSNRCCRSTHSTTMVVLDIPGSNWKDLNLRTLFLRKRHGSYPICRSPKSRCMASTHRLRSSFCLRRRPLRSSPRSRPPPLLCHLRFFASRIDPSTRTIRPQLDM